ncbi:TPA: sulfatase-like hydrolase/transferase [Salmonella enterica subsp. enterica serovar Typhi]|nr:sulfatase [Salmonella enterica subsp. enterica serovar Typhi]
MKAIILLFDSLNKNYLPPYGDLLTKAPNFQRLAAHAATFDNSYVGSMPCMPARRELLIRLMKENDAPAEQYRRLGLDVV